MSGIRPQRTSSTDIFTSGATMRMSAPSAIWNPPPSATPWTAAITGAGISCHTNAACWPGFVISPPRRGVTFSRFVSLSPAIAWNEPKSRPAQKARPSPDSTTARTDGSVFSASPVSTSAEKSAPSSAFIFSGRFIRTSATPFSIVQVTRSDMSRVWHAPVS